MSFALECGDLMVTAGGARWVHRKLGVKNMQFKDLAEVLAAEQQAGLDLPLGSALNMVTPDEVEGGVGLYITRLPIGITAVVFANSSGGPEYTVVESSSGSLVAEGSWAEVAPALTGATVAVSV